jgi:tetratricopeptide (TPR) repeat protein/DNA-binding SARP family transcriptional activator
MDPARGNRPVGFHFGLLGPFEIHNNGVPIVVDGATDQAVIVALLLKPEGYANATQLITAVWGEPAAIQEESLYRRISGLRRFLRDHGLDIGKPTRGDPYALPVDRGAVDAHRFRAALTAAYAIEDTEPDEALRRLRAALALWRGPAAVPALTQPGVRALAHALDTSRLDAESRLADLEISRGDPDAALPRVRELATAHRSHPGITAALIALLRATGRHPEAAAALDAAERHFRGQLPAKIQQAYDRTATPPKTATAWIPPAELPPTTRHFVGREAELSQLMLPPAPDGTRTNVVSAVNGMPGVGKTALVVRAAHRMIEAGWFPDGALYVELRGVSDQAAITPGEALQLLLRRLDVQADRIPQDLDARSALLRTVLSQRRILMVLDNASAEPQVRPLLPGTSRSLVLVTSRRRLNGLDDADQIYLDTLPMEQAIALFRSVVSPREAGDEATVEEIVRLCGLLPLAIRVAATRLKETRALDGPWLLSKLRETSGRLALLDDGERSIATALAVSLQHLPPLLRTAFAILGQHPGPDLEPYAASALLDIPRDPAVQVLRGLEQANLLDQPQAGRYQFHDLVHTYAETQPSPAGALQRLFDFYRAATTAAVDLAHPSGAEDRPATASVEVPFASAEEARHWLDVELSNLLAAAYAAITHENPAHALHQSETLAPHLRTLGKYESARELHRYALEVARSTGDVKAQIGTLTALGHTYRLLGRYDLSVDSFVEAIDLAVRSDRTAAMDALAGLGHVYSRRGEYDRATRSFERSLRYAQQEGSLRGAIDALTGLASIHYMQGRIDRAADNYDQARKLAGASGNRQGEFDAALGLAYCIYYQGDLTGAAEAFMRSLELARDLGSALGESNSIAGLGHVARSAGRYGSAARYYARVLDLAKVSGDRHGRLGGLVGLGHIHRGRGDLAQAQRHYVEAIALASEGGSSPSLAMEAHLGLGHTYVALGQADRALSEFTAALEMARELDHPPEMIRALDGMATAHAMDPAELDRAKSLWQDALTMLVKLGLPAVEEVSVDSLRAHLEES